MKNGQIHKNLAETDAEQHGANAVEPMLAQAEQEGLSRKSHGGLNPAAALCLLAVLGGVTTGLLDVPRLFPAQQEPAPLAMSATPSRTAPLPAPSEISFFQSVPSAEWERAIGGMLIGDPEKAKLRDEVASGSTRIARLAVSDSEVEDGDWVTISAAGYSQDIQLFHRPTVVIVPYVPGAPVAVTGLIDGDGGGITVALHLGNVKLPLAPLRVGKTVQVFPP